MQRKPIANKYRKGTMKSTFHSTYATHYFIRFGESKILHHAYKLQREWKREWNRLTEYYFCIWLYNFFTCYSTHTHTHIRVINFTVGTNKTFFYSAKYNRTECLCVFFDGSGLLRTFYITLHALLFLTRHNYPTRLETRTKEFNWIASRRDFFHETHYRRSESKLVRNKIHTLSRVCIKFYCSTGWLRICIETCAVCILLSLLIKD